MVRLGGAVLSCLFIVVLTSFFCFFPLANKFNSKVVAFIFFKEKDMIGHDSFILLYKKQGVCTNISKQE